MEKRPKNTGFGLLEVVVGVSIIAGSIFALFAVVNGAFQMARENVRNTQAAFLAEEGFEALRVLRDSSWDGNIAVLSDGTPYELEFSGGEWRAVSGPALIDGIFERKFVLEGVGRDSGGNIVLSGGTPDQNTKKVIVSVSWRTRNATTTKIMATYLANLFGN